MYVLNLRNSGLDDILDTNSSGHPGDGSMRSTMPSGAFEKSQLFQATFWSIYIHLFRRVNNLKMKLMTSLVFKMDFNKVISVILK
jgi:hypothetical protein